MPNLRTQFLTVPAGLVRCRRCGRKLTVRYTGTQHNIPRYACHRGLLG